MNSKYKYYWWLLLAPVIFLAWYLLARQRDEPLRHLAYFGPKNALKANDTSYHQIPAFQFTNQYGKITDEHSVKGKIYVAEFFFTTCQSICPIMNSNLDRVYGKFKNNNNFLILSHTVDPDHDSTEVLKAYSDMHEVKDEKWLFLTGPKEKLYEIARKGYLLDASEGNGGEEDFVHTQIFALVDQNRHIRGFYDGTDSLDVDRMIREVEILSKENAFENKIN
jgi:protein SCO1/2